jgi:WD40 repeat protein
MAGRAAAHGDYPWLASVLFSFPVDAALTAATYLKEADYYPGDGDPGYWKALYTSPPEGFEYPYSPFPVPAPFDGSGARYCSVSVSPGGTILAAGTWNGDLELWQVPGGGILRTIRTRSGPVHSLTFNQDGTFLAFSTRDGEIFVVTSHDGEVLRKFPARPGGVGTLCWLSNRDLAAGGCDGTLIVLSTADEGPVAAGEGATAPTGITTMVTSGQGTIFCGYADGTVRGWDHGLQLKVRFRSAHDGPVLSLACHKKDPLLVSGALRGPFLIHSRVSGELAGMAGSSGSVRSAITITPDGSWCAAGSGTGILEIWSVPDGLKIARHFIHRDGIRTVASSPDGERVIAGTSAGFLHIVPVRGSRPPVIVKGFTGGIYQASASVSVIAGLGWQGVVEVRDLSGGELVQRMEGRGGTVSSLAVQDTAGILALATTRGFIHFWDLGDISYLGFIDAFVPSVTALSVSQDRCFVMVAGNDGSLNLLRVADGSISRHFHGHQGTIHALAWSPDGTLCAAGGWDTRIRLYRTQGVDPPLVLSGHRSPVTDLAFSPQGDILASTSQDRTIRLWDLAKERERTILEGHKGVVTTISFSPDGRMLASGGRDRTVRLWSLPDACSTAILEGHEDHVTSLAFPAPGILASGDRKGGVAYWSLPDGERVRMEKSDSGSVVGLATTPGDPYLLSVHQKGLCLFWHLPWTKLPREVSPTELETIRAYLRASRENNGRQEGLWKFIEMLSRGHLRSSAASVPEPPLAAGYEIELAGGLP